MTRRQLLSLAAASSARGEVPQIEKSEVFKAGTSGYSTYRIPGLVVTSRGSILAYCEARKNPKGDWGAIDIMLRRGTDGGKSWSPQRIIASVAGPHHKNPVALAQKLATEGEVTYNNPVAIADRQRGVVHFVFCIEYMRAFCMRSDDDGQTFSAPREITPAFEPFRREYDWKVLATGPGHGIQLSNGRLVIPVWLSLGTGGHAHRPSVAATIFSDDQGTTWQRGEIALPNRGEWNIPNETAAVELSDGSVMLNARSESAANRRLITVSKDGATGWSTPQFHPQLMEPICMGSMVRYSTRKFGGKDRLLFANPDNLERTGAIAEPGKPRDRKNVTVKLSYDEGKTWPVSRAVEPGYSGYSDLAVLTNGSILLLYEKAADGAKAFQPDSLTLAKFPLAWLTNGADVSKKVAR